MSNSLQPHGLEPTRLRCLWASPGKNTRVGCHSLLQGIFLNQGLDPALLYCRHRDVATAVLLGNSGQVSPRCDQQTEVWQSLRRTQAKKATLGQTPGNKKWRSNSQSSLSKWTTYKGPRCHGSSITSRKRRSEAAEVRGCGGRRSWSNVVRKERKSRVMSAQSLRPVKPSDVAAEVKAFSDTRQL